MRQAKHDPSRQPTLVGHSIDPLRVVSEGAPIQGATPTHEVVSLERRALFGSGIELQYPARLVWPSPWVGHIPFAFWLVETLRPRVMVELGVHSGNSYCAFQQAIQSLSIASQCYGIDHWRGDEHSDQYGDDVYTELRAYHDPLYGTFSTLIQATFEEARPYFSDQSVDLLHIDGFHTYEAVARDFSDWLPKVSTRGVVLFHDIAVREREFGVWRFWEEIAERYETFAFVHSHGLGLAYVGSEPPPGPLRTLLAMSDLEISRTRSYFARLGTSIIDRFARRQAESIASRVGATEADLEATRGEMHRHVETSDVVRSEVEKVTAELAVLRDELATARAEAARRAEEAAKLHEELSVSRASRFTIEELTTQVAALGHELSCSRGQVGEAIAQRERATQLLRQQITVTAGLQRELAALRPNEAVAALVNRLAAVKHRIPRPVKHYFKKHVLGFRL